MTPGVTADLVTGIVSSANDTGQSIDSGKRVAGFGVLPVDTIDKEGSLDVLAVQIVEQSLSQNRRTVVKC
jgi:hypothetical protein